MRSFKLVRHLRRLATRGCMSSTFSVVKPEHDKYLSNSARALKSNSSICYVSLAFFAFLGGERAGFCCPIKSCRTPHRIVSFQHDLCGGEFLLEDGLAAQIGLYLARRGRCMQLRMQFGQWAPSNGMEWCSMLSRLGEG